MSGPADPLWPDSGPATYNYIQPMNRLFAKRHNARRERGDGQSASSKSKKQSMVFGEYDDDAGYDGPNMLTAHIRVKTTEDIKEVIHCLEYEDGAGLMSITRKPHQETDSSAKMKFFNVPRDTDIGGLAVAFQALLKSAQKSMLKAGKLDHNQIDILPKFMINFKQQRKGKNRSKEDEILSLKNVPGYKLNECPVIEVEMGDEDF